MKNQYLLEPQDTSYLKIFNLKFYQLLNEFDKTNIYLKSKFDENKTENCKNNSFYRFIN